MKAINKIILLGISLILMSVILPLFVVYFLYIPIPYDIPNGTVCTDGCGQIPMTDPSISIIFIFVLPIAVIIAIIIYAFQLPKTDKEI